MLFLRLINQHAFQQAKNNDDCCKTLEDVTKKEGMSIRKSSLLFESSVYPSKKDLTHLGKGLPQRILMSA